MSQENELYGWKQIAPLWGCSVRHAQRLIKQYNIGLNRIGDRGHIRMAPEKALELKKLLGLGECRTLSHLPL